MTTSKILKNRQSKIKADAILNGFSFQKQRDFENEEREQKNTQTEKLAQVVYESYLSQGEEIAEERKNLYLKRNLK